MHLSHVEYGTGFKDVGGTDAAGEDDNGGGGATHAGFSQSGSAAVDSLVVVDDGSGSGLSSINQEGELLSSSLIWLYSIFSCTTLNYSIGQQYFQEYRHRGTDTFFFFTFRKVGL